jgi:hypothetical protein
MSELEKTYLFLEWHSFEQDSGDVQQGGQFFSSAWLERLHRRIGSVVKGFLVDTDVAVDPPNLTTK